MGRPEALMRQTVRQALRGLDPVSVENPAHPGTPDLNHAHGWIELKRCDGWPIRPTTPLRLPHFTAQQRVWLTRRARLAACHLLLRVGQPYDSAHVWLLFRGDVAARVVGLVGRVELEAHALSVWSPRLDPQQLRTILIQPWTPSASLLEDATPAA